MGLSNMETKKTNSQFLIDYKFGKVTFRRPTTEEDTKWGIDAWVSDIPFFWRKRTIPITQYGQISIRESRTSGAKTDYQKFLDGDIKSQVCFFEFTDAVIICLSKDILTCLKMKRLEHHYNPNGTTSAIYVNLEDIPHLFLKRESQKFTVEDNELPDI